MMMVSSTIWRNTGNGNYVRDDMGIDMTSDPASDNSGNYGIVFTDFDNDGDQDFYISKCRAGVTDPNDGRRINQLFVNDGANHYTEMAFCLWIARWITIMGHRISRYRQ
ncbi:MAG: VCBS repeat-containing protein [Saprospiraceae bacterium]